MNCKMCEQFWDWIYDLSHAWERAHSNEAKLWSEESERASDLAAKARAIQDSDPGAALQLYHEAADAGSVWSMEVLGWHYSNGIATEQDPVIADDFYRRAIASGSLMAIIGYAQFLKNGSRRDECSRVLEDGIAAGFVPASFWLARFRYMWAPNSASCKEVRPILEFAAKQGHPFARITLARWQVMGQLGIGEIPTGIRSSFALIGALVGHEGNTDKGLAALAKLQ
ncbi:MAG: hypothetical protein SFV20_07090 [Sphingopyxis sp.]|nr:hypothetical protein [Sphingopyxis sp.]